MNRGEVIVQGAKLQALIVDLPPGEYPLRFESVEPYKKSYVQYTFSLEDGTPIITIAPVYTAVLDPGEPSHQYTLIVIRERASNK